MSELLRHRHTVEQYGVRVEIPTKAHRISHSSARSYHTRHARGHVLSRLSDSGGCPNARRLYARSPLPGENCQPPCGRDRNQAAAHGPLSGCKGSCALVTGRRDVGEPLVQPVRASPSHCPSRRPPTFYASSDLRSDRWPAGREVGAAVPGSEEPGERTCSLSAAPSPSRPPVKAVSTRGAAEGMLLADQNEHLGLEPPGLGCDPCAEKLAPQQSQAGQGWATRGVVDLSSTVHQRVLSRFLAPLSRALSLSLS